MIKLPLAMLASAILYLMSFWTNDTVPVVKEDKIDWVSIDVAQELVKDNPRKVFIDIYADWCGWCKVMDRKTFSNDKVSNYINDNYYAVRIDAESQNKVTFKGKEFTEQDLVKSFKVQGLPTIVFIDENFQKVKPVAGYQNASQFLKSLEKFNR